MERNETLQLAHPCRVLVGGAGNIEVRLPGGSAVDCGDYGFDVLSVFARPQPFQLAVDALTRRLGSASALIAALGLVERMRAAGILIPETPGRAALPKGFSSASSHIDMLNDRHRTDAFLSAVRATVRPGDVVLDLGTGTGVLAIAAAQAGARRVFAIEGGGMAPTAAEMFAASGVGDRITLVPQWSTRVTLDERADVLVSETLGANPWEEGFRLVTADARDRLLKPGARIIPSHVSWIAQLVSVPADVEQGLRFTPQLTAEWTARYGVDFSPLAGSGDRHTGTARIGPRRVASWPRTGAPMVLEDFDVSAGTASPRVLNGTTTATEAMEIGGVILYWAARLTQDIEISTSPYVSLDHPSWSVLLILAASASTVAPGDRVQVALTTGEPPCLALTIARP